MTREPDISLSTERLLQCQEALGQLQQARAEIERLTNAIRRIDAINDNPAVYNPAINAVCDAILRPHLEPKPLHDRIVARVDEYGVAYNAAGESIGMTGKTGHGCVGAVGKSKP